LTVMVCFVGSGNNSTRRPLARRYSVMPSTDVTFSGGAGTATAGGGATASAFGFLANAGTAHAVSAANNTRVFDGFMGDPSSPLILSVAARLQSE